MARLLAILGLALILASPAWRPDSLSEQSTIEFLTVGPTEGKHWSTVWFVVIDGAMYLRLGSRAAGRIAQNATAPNLQVRTKDGSLFDLRYEEAPEMADRIRAEMAKKYWSDAIGEPFRKLGLTHPPLMLRLRSGEGSSPAP